MGTRLTLARVSEQMTRPPVLRYPCAMAKENRQRPERPSQRRAQEGRTTPSPPGLPRVGAAAFVGRERELDEVGRLFDRGARLVTLVGAGGVGKTRLCSRP
jgi:hypothetical protein